MAIATDIQTVKKVNLYLGAGALVVGCLMTAEFGRSMSWLHAGSLCILSIAAAFLPTYAHHLWGDGARVSASIFGIVCALFITVEYFSHLGYTVGHRIRDTEETTVSNVAYDAVQDNLKSEKENLAMWRKQLADLKAQNAWTATVTADALRARLDVATEAIRQEEMRGGCGPRCLNLKREKSDLDAKIATAEAVGDLAKRIEATQRIIDSKVDKATHAEFKSSKVVNQTKFVSQLATLSLEPDKAAFTWSQIGIGAMIALVTTFLPAVCFFVAFRDRKGAVPFRESTVAQQKATSGTLLHPAPAMHHAPAPVAQQMAVAREVIRDSNDFARRIAARLARPATMPA